MSERKERCETCRFWADVDTESTGLGDCHRYPPAMGLASRDGDLEVQDAIKPQDGGWPLTWPTDWCGEWQAIPSATVKTFKVPLTTSVADFFRDEAVPRNVFRRYRIETIGELIEKTVDNLLELKNFGMVGLWTVRAKLAQVGLQLKDDNF